MEDVTEEKRNFIGIGKILFDTPAEDWNIPNLHFIVSRCGEAVFEAVNLEFGLVAIGDSGLNAAQGLASLASTYLISVIKEGKGFKELRELVKKNVLFDLWGEFRAIEFQLAETGDDLSHHLYKHINKTLYNSFSDKVKEALERKAGDMAEEILSLLSMRPPLVEYQEIEGKAA